MKKILCIALSLLLMIGLVACGNNKEDSKQTKEVKATPAEIDSKIKEALGQKNYLCDVDITKELLSDGFGFDMSKIESFVAKENSITSVNMDKIIILKVKDGYADTAVEILNKSYARTVSYIHQYAFGTSKVLNARLYNTGSYVIFVLAGANYTGEDAKEEAKLAKEGYEKIDNALTAIFGTLPKNSAVIPKDNEETTSDKGGGAIGKLGG